MSRLIIVLCSLVLTFLVSGCAETDTLVGQAEQPVVVKKVVRTYTFPNGVTLMAKDCAAGGPTAVQVWVSDGTLTDDELKPGLAHLVEHMLFTGSEHMPPGKAEEYLEGMGGELVGHTWRDFSYIGVTLPGPGWDRALDILFDLAAYPSFAPEQFEKQKKVVSLEINQRTRDMKDVLIDNFFGAAYQKHQYRFSVTGTTADVAALTRDDVVSYYKRTYVPSNMVIVVIGDIDPPAVRAAVEKTFGRLAPGSLVRPDQEQEPYQLDKRKVEVSQPVKLTYMALGWHVAAASDRDIYALDVLRAVLGLGRGSRLFMGMRERMGVVLDVDAELFPLREPGVLVVTAYLKEEDLKQGVDEILRQVNMLKDEPVSESELARAKNDIEASHLLASETVEGQAYSLGYWGAVYGGGDPSEYTNNIRKVTTDDIRLVAQKYLGEGNYTLSVIRPEGQ